MNVKIINQSNNPLPAYATEGSSGMDIRAFINETVTLQPLERALIPTGLFIELPQGFEILATTDSIPVAAFRKNGSDTNPLYGLQFHPEVYHSTEGKKIISNFLVRDRSVLVCHLRK